MRAIELQTTPLDRIDGWMKSNPKAVFCSVCSMWLNSKRQWESHMAGDRHRRQARLQAADDPAVAVLCTVEAGGLRQTRRGGVKLQTKPQDRTDGAWQNWIQSNPKAVFCSVCDMWLNSVRQFEIHMAGAKHQRQAGLQAAGQTRRGGVKAVLPKVEEEVQEEVQECADPCGEHSQTEASSATCARSSWQLC